jgi:hypothetical protein
MTRPTVTIDSHSASGASAISSPGRDLLISEIDDDSPAVELSCDASQRANRGGGAPFPANHSAQFARRHRQLDDRVLRPGGFDDLDRLGPTGEGPRDDFHNIARAAHDAACS